MALVFVATGPHRWWVALLMLPGPIALVLIDRLSGRTHAPPATRSSAAYDALLVFHALLHFAIVGLYLRIAVLAGPSVDLVIGGILVGHNTGWSALIVAHELVHRRSAAMRALGRALLCTTFYDHFAVEHVRGHHVRVGTPDDPATARFDETLSEFKRRTIPAQFRSAWALEQKRLAGRSVLGNRVLHGVLIEVALTAGIALVLGPWALAAWLYQAFEAINLLEAVNYLEHWGLQRAAGRVTPMHSWDTDSAFTTWALIGLARHADHHANPSRPYPCLRENDESPKLPYGYPLMIFLAVVANDRFRALMTEELRRRRLGPFAASANA
jgi:alkane 1-monooxygenase